MHPSAMLNAQLFFRTYLPQGSGERVVEIGAQDVNGSLREVATSNVAYVGVDFVKGKGVDVVLEDPYKLPFDSDSVDVCLSSSVFEHSEMFWVLFLEIVRILKPGGLFYLNVPSNGAFHRYPVDCWRFYPDSGRALVNWAKRSGASVAMLESFVSAQDRDMWNDFVAVFVKDERLASRHPRRILDTKTDFTNGQLLGADRFTNFREFPEDLAKLMALSTVVRQMRAGAPDKPSAPPTAAAPAAPAPPAAPSLASASGNPFVGADPWEGCHPIRMLAAPDWDNPGDGWAEALGNICAGIQEGDSITVGVVGPASTDDLPADFVSFAQESAADIVVFPRPENDAAWHRLVGGATLVILTGEQRSLRARAERAGAEVVDGRTMAAPAADSEPLPASGR